MAYKAEALSQRAKNNLQALWASRDAQRNDILTRCEDYAYWTLPGIFPKSNSKTVEIKQMSNSIGARCVNHLANKIVTTLFPAGAPFFRLTIRNDDVQKIVEKAKLGDIAAKDAMAQIDAALATKEKSAMEVLNYNTFRTEATTVAKRLIITGNALMYHPPGGGRVQTYSLRDYTVQRDLSGQVIEIMTRDTKVLGTLSKQVRDALRAHDKAKYRSDDRPICIYTLVKLDEKDGRYVVTQSAENVLLDTKVRFVKSELPWIALTWNLLRGENYGRGLVEDYAGTFNALEVLSESLLSLVGVAADIKWLVKPSSLLDVAALNKAPTGSYHTGEEGDLTAAQLNKSVDIQLVENAVARFEQQLGQAFLLNSSVTRQAERVTAEEIRYMAQELETSNGGIYSHLADTWQLPTAIIILRDVEIKVGDSSSIIPQIITGLDSLSRAGDLDNFRMYVSDLALLNGIPEELRIFIDPIRLSAWIGTRRGVESVAFTKTQQQVEAEQQAAMQKQQQMVQNQGATDAMSGVAQQMAKSGMENK